MSDIVRSGNRSLSLGLVIGCFNLELLVEDGSPDDIGAGDNFEEDGPFLLLPLQKYILKCQKHTKKTTTNSLVAYG